MSCQPWASPMSTALLLVVMLPGLQGRDTAFHGGQLVPLGALEPGCQGLGTGLGSCFVAALQQPRLQLQIRGGGFEEHAGSEDQDQEEQDILDQLAGSWIDKMSSSPALNSKRTASIIDPFWFGTNCGPPGPALMYQDVRLLEGPAKEPKQASARHRPKRRRCSESDCGHQGRSTPRQLDKGLKAMVPQENIGGVPRISSMPNLMIRPRLRIHANRNPYIDAYSSSDCDPMQDLIQSSTERERESKQRVQWVESCLRTSARALDPPSWSRSQLQALDEPRRSRSKSRSSLFETIVRTEGCVRFQSTETTRVELVTEAGQTFRRSKSRKQVRVRVSKSCTTETSVSRGRKDGRRSKSVSLRSMQSSRPRITEIIQSNHADLCTRPDSSSNSISLPSRLGSIFSWMDIQNAIQLYVDMLQEQFPELNSEQTQSTTNIAAEKNMQECLSSSTHHVHDLTAEETSTQQSLFGFPTSQAEPVIESLSDIKLLDEQGKKQPAKQTGANPIICASESFAESAEEVMAYVSESDHDDMNAERRCRIPRWAQIASLALAGCFYSPLLLVP